MKKPPSTFLFALAALAAASCVDAVDDDPAGPELGTAESDLTFNCGGEGNCECSVVLANVIDGTPYNASHLAENLGPADARDMFTNGGSENIAVLCRSAKYLLDHDVAWMERYVDVQLDSGLPFFFDGEAFSSTYASQVIGPLIASLDHARDRGHTAFVNKASRLLRAYWTLLALAAVDHNATGVVFHNKHGVETGTPTAIDKGYSLGLAGMRSYVNGRSGNPGSAGADGLQPLLLSMALENPRRTFTWSLNNSPGFYGGLRATVRTAGYNLNDAGKIIGALNARSVAPAMYGLTAAERTALRDYIASHGTTGLSTVRGYLDGIQLRCNFSIIRTAGGVITFWGRSDQRVAVCPSGKGGTWAASKVTTGGLSTFMTRAPGRWGDGDAGEIWREGASICAEGGLPRLCLDIPAGTFHHELRLGQGGGATCVAGCGGNPPPMPWPPVGWTPKEPLVPLP